MDLAKLEIRSGRARGAESVSEAAQNGERAQLEARTEHQMNSKPIGWQYHELAAAIDGAVLQAAQNSGKV